MIHEGIIINSSKAIKNRIAESIETYLSRYPKLEFINSGLLYSQLVDAGYIDAKDKLRRKQLEIILAIIKSA